MLRVGLGYDSHRFDASRRLVLGGVVIAGEPGLFGHSDADVVFHAVIDAMLGASGLGDIGEQFPDTDPAWRGVNSAELVGLTVAKLAVAGWRAVNCDVTVLAERPRLTPHKPAMRENLARLLSLRPDAVGVKAKTNEGLGWIGRGEGIAAMAVVMVESTNGRG